MQPCPRGAVRCALVATFALVLALLLPATAGAQPYGAFLVLSNSNPGYVNVPHSFALNPVGAITIEGWVSVNDPGPSQCRSIIGKNWRQSWWVGYCGDQLRSFIRGETSMRQAGVVADGLWHHFAVTFNGATRCHYVDGVSAGCWADGAGALPASTAPVRIGSDVQWAFTPSGAINEIRLWGVSRSGSQIRTWINQPITSPQPGLIAAWTHGGPADSVGPHDGTPVGNAGALTFPVTNIPCSNTPTSLCLHGRYQVSVRWRTTSNEGLGRLTPLVSNQSGVFWFFNASNWELMVKVLNGCVVNGHWWMFSAATTNVFYRVTVLDRHAGVQRIWFNYQGPPAPAVTDTAAFATCP